jgi:CheY-like chemotaxis protein
MALKVLLADDSAAIKKVVQLSLQDLGVELKAISSGKDAVEVAKQFKPHIAFVDVLLPQKSGYDVTSEIKKESSLSKVPVILLWSAFMAFDEGKYRSCGADAKLEKPFDSSALRDLVAKFVPAVSMEAPSVEFEMPIGSVPPAKKVEKPKTEVADNSKPGWSMSSFEEIPPIIAPEPAIPEIPSVVKNQSSLSTPDPANWNNDNEWVRKDLGKFQVPIPQEINEDEGLGEAVPFTYTESKIIDTSFLFKPQDASTSTMLGKPAFTEQSAASIAQNLNERLPENLSLEELSDLKLQTREIIEKVVWKLVPELASQMIREELDRLLAEK